MVQRDCTMSEAIPANLRGNQPGNSSIFGDTVVRRDLLRVAVP